MLITCYSSIHNDLEETIHLSMGASLVAQMVKNLLAMQETRVQSLGQEDFLVKGMATHFSILAWKIPWMEEPGRLKSMAHKKLDMTEQLTLDVSTQCS